MNRNDGAVGDARKRNVSMSLSNGQARESVRQEVACVLSTHADPEEYARIYNEGYEAAMAQHLADDPSAADDWLARVIADAKAEALREAARTLPGFVGGINTHGDAARWLRLCADRIDREAAR